MFFLVVNEVFSLAALAYLIYLSRVQVYAIRVRWNWNQIQNGYGTYDDNENRLRLRWASHYFRSSEQVDKIFCTYMIAQPSFNKARRHQKSNSNVRRTAHRHRTVDSRSKKSLLLYVIPYVGYQLPPDDFDLENRLTRLKKSCSEPWRNGFSDSRIGSLLFIQGDKLCMAVQCFYWYVICPVHTCTVAYTGQLSLIIQ